VQHAVQPETTGKQRKLSQVRQALVLLDHPSTQASPRISLPHMAAPLPAAAQTTPALSIQQQLWPATALTKGGGVLHLDETSAAQDGVAGKKLLAFRGSHG
jgi:hypothetical protein